MLFAPVRAALNPFETDDSQAFQSGIFAVGQRVDDQLGITEIRHNVLPYNLNLRDLRKCFQRKRAFVSDQLERSEFRQGRKTLDIRIPIRAA